MYHRLENLRAANPLPSRGGVTRCFVVILLLLLVPLLTPAQHPDSLLGRNKLKYTKERPLIYEGAQDLWPYSFLNDNGEPDGYNVELIKMILDNQNIPYEIKMKPRLMAFKDLREGRSDLMIGLVAGFHEEFAHYSENSVTLFTQSVLSPRSNPTTIRNFRDLQNHHVIVNDSSLCHHLMIDYGWGDNAIPTRNIGEAIMQMSTDEEGELVWNTLSLKWLLHKFQITNLEVTPVNMPHGEYKFMSSDEHLIHLMDSVFSEMNASEEILQLQNKWFYPERQETRKDWPLWAKRGAVVLGIVMLFLLMYAIFYQLQARRITRENNRRAKRFALILETSGVRIWTYDVQTKTFAWRSDDGKVAYNYTAEEFAQRYPLEDAERLQQAIMQLSTQQGSDTPDELTLHLKARDNEDGDNTLHDFTVRLSVLQRDKKGMPTTLIGTKADVTEKLHEQRLTDERTMRFNAIFNTPLVSILYFNADGILVDLNDRACQVMECRREDILADKVKLKHLFDIGDMTPEEMDGYQATLFVDMNSLSPERRNVTLIKSKEVLCDEFTLTTVYDDNHSVIGIFAVCRSVSHIRLGVHQQQEYDRHVYELKQQLAHYQHHIDSVLHESDVRLAVYSTATHTLEIFRSANEVQHTLSQTRCMNLSDNRSQKLVMRTLAVMDQRADHEIVADVQTKLRIKGGHQLSVQFRLAPHKDPKGNIIAYVGLCRDFSELKHLEQQIAVENAKVQEVENTKNMFVKNMVMEIHTPMNTIVDFVNQLPSEKSSPDEERLRQGITDNADTLLALIDKVLFLSRLEAHMIDIHPQPCDYSQLFGEQCKDGWTKHRNANTKYVVENPYDELIVNIDSENMGHIIRQLTSNAAIYTATGTVRARCEYIGRRLIVSVDDTGGGIPPEELAKMQQPKTQNTPAIKGLGLAICRELVNQMNGSFEVTSEQGSGTTVYVTIPCQAISIRRKKN